MQRAPEERLGLFIVALYAIEVGQPGQGESHLGMVMSQPLFIYGEGVLDSGSAWSYWARRTR